ncbi:xanthine dehydrogenase family protein subunit M [Kineosporia sp. A_224]|uniref:FAD binding domain-containing protein n=1 Tax=Kineosporia sp. A_224 TaxID=1962180 RepID=UPI000B4A6C57|nr:FAD binding domain-containing protein [Kineosporia sp. A_224]
MKPSPFTYHRPENLEQALALLADVGSEGKVLAGGQSLLPILSMRLAAPAHLVDVNRLTDLAYVRSGPDGVHVGALARHRTVERDAEAHAALPLLRQALEHVAHPTIRNRGTSVGSLAHADPSGELTAVLALTGGRVDLACAAGRRSVAAMDFFLGPLESAVRPGELAVEAWFPAFPAGTGTAFVEAARRHGDYAMAGLAAAVTVVDGRVTSARAAYISMSPVPVVVELTHDAPTDAADAAVPAAWAGAAEAAVDRLEPEADLHASAHYRAHLARTLTGRAMARAVAGAVSPDVRPRAEEAPA